MEYLVDEVEAQLEALEALEALARAGTEAEERMLLARWRPPTASTWLAEDMALPMATPERREQQRVVMATAPVEVPVVGKSRKKRSRPGARVANTTSWKRMSYRATVVHADAPEQPPMRFKTSVRKTKAQSAADRRAGRELQRRAALRLKFSSTGRTEPEGPAAVRARNRTFVA
ncbi:uncharacterized protein AMSG_09636 [Thecamonas trahens ATCC 50062]|uniref:Uncharacterized protein n=1 Tax=Thecamonas trahens ATCC 50062 TaxID=461836 RepID=A0A0L0DNT7_THETB|nr:hypothetical protein AMSG_09636 [Thecamonas trahens ATCC 50062]KNC53987.1 hypothetical protein AMSG_09636 [Thecamonas trahens ATCC 50062]|eukprot:XP_013754189.1 hypothetical protein AMSG_09636 [Thecamonas trahens ATCC 50062]